MTAFERLARQAGLHTDVKVRIDFCGYKQTGDCIVLWVHVDLYGSVWIRKDLDPFVLIHVDLY